MWAKSSKELIQLQQTNPMIKENSSNCKMCTAASRYLGIQERRMLLFAFSQESASSGDLAHLTAATFHGFGLCNSSGLCLIVIWLQAVSVPETVSPLVLRCVLNLAFSF